LLAPSRDHYDAPHHVNPGVTSVALTAYNTQTFVADFIGSVHAQNLPVTEVIFVDDGFLDKTAEMACATRQRGLSQPNRGLSAGRNAGIEAATRHRFALLDAVRPSILGGAAHT
jgi:glycosyltransferase involved in cell wall biosynthesis